MMETEHVWRENILSPKRTDSYTSKGTDHSVRLSMTLLNPEDHLESGPRMQFGSKLLITRPSGGLWGDPEFQGAPAPAPASNTTREKLNGKEERARLEVRKKSFKAKLNNCRSKKGKINGKDEGRECGDEKAGIGEEVEQTIGEMLSATIAERSRREQWGS